MLLIPAIDIISGECVRLTEGDYATKKVYRHDPAAVAKEFEQMGFRRLHVVDLDGAKSRHIVNDKVLAAICRETRLVVDFGGGIKTEDDLRRAFDAGAALTTVGSVAAKDPDRVLAWAETYGADRLILGADTRGGKISTNGWLEDSDIDLDAFLTPFLSAGIKRVLSTDIARDGRLAGPATALYKSILKAHPDCQLIASGGVGGLDDIHALHEAGLPAVVFGKAIYEGRIDLPTLLRLYPQDVC